jgi:Arc/MetJ-type ribon-helix-helix transcriptional regulator
MNTIEKMEVVKMDKYDISKSFKIGNGHIEKINALTKERNFKSDSEAMRYSIDFVHNLHKLGLLDRAIAMILEEGSRDEQ